MFLRGPKVMPSDPEDPRDPGDPVNCTLAPYKSAKGRPANGRPANGRTANWHSQLANWQLQDSKEWQLTDWKDGKGWHFGRLATELCPISLHFVPFGGHGGGYMYIYIYIYMYMFFHFL